MAGPDGHPDQHRLTAAERVERNRRIAEAKASELTWERVAEAFGVSEKTARRAARAHAEGAARLRLSDGGGPPEPPADLDPQAIFTEVVAVHLDVMRDLANVREASNPAARVGAQRVRITAGQQLIAILAEVGLMPSPEEVLIARAAAARSRRAARAEGEALIGRTYDHGP